MSSRERIADLTETINSLVHWNRSISSDLQRPQRVEAEIEREMKTIAACQARIVRYQDNLVHGHERMEQNDARIAQLRQEITLEQNKLKIERLLELVGQINDFESSDSSSEPSNAVAACESEIDLVVETNEDGEPVDDVDSYDPTDEDINDEGDGVDNG